MITQDQYKNEQSKMKLSPVKRKIDHLKEITVLIIDPSTPDPLKPLSAFDDDLFSIDKLKDSLYDLPGYNITFRNDLDNLNSYLQKNRTSIDFVFNLCEKGHYNDPRMELHIPALLESLGVNYTGSGPQCLASCYDKLLVRRIAKEMEIPVPEALVVKSRENNFKIPFGFPVIAKPNFGDSSFVITQKSVARSIEELVIAISQIRDNSSHEKPIIVEEFVPGKDLSVGILGNLPDDYTVLPIIEEDYSELPSDLPRICDYEAKWDPNSPYWDIISIPAMLEEDISTFITRCCLKLFERLECRDYCRFDWRLDSKGNPKLLKVNPNPGWFWDGHLAKMAHLDGILYTDMLSIILKAAKKRISSSTWKINNLKKGIVQFP